jgi:hypothetical protein
MGSTFLTPLGLGGKTVAHFATLIRQVGLASPVKGAVPLAFLRAGGVGLGSGRGKDWRLVADTSGVIGDRVMIKLTPSSPETPFANGRVWLLRLADGYKAWEGFSDAQGYYTARGLEVGAAYIAVGIDPYAEHKATGAGPVIATAGAA